MIDREATMERGDSPDPWGGPEEFPILGESVFLNHAAVAPLPARASGAMKTYAEEACREGGGAWPGWARQLQEARGCAASLLGAQDEEVAFIHNTTHGLLCLANSLPWRPGDNIITAEHEFPANVYPWLNLSQRGVELRVVPERADHRFALQDFEGLIDGRTRMIAISLVQYSTGYRMPVEPLAEICRCRGIWFVLDAIQAVGAMPTPVHDLGCDFLVADGHKWMLSPEGIGVLYVRRDRLDLFNQSMVGWVGRARPWDYSDTRQPLVDSARRFEEGSYNMAGAVALNASLGLIVEIGIERVWGAIESLTGRLCQGLERLGFEVVSPRGEGERSGIVVCRRPGLDPESCMKRLAAEGIHIAARRGWIRISPHGYNRPEQIDTLLEALAEWAQDMNQ